MRRLIASAGLALALAACGGGGLEPLPRRADAVAAPAVLASEPAVGGRLADPAGARGRFEGALARSPDEVPALNDLAVTYLVEGRPEAARQLLDEVLARGGSREQQTALVNLAAIYAQDGYLAAARAHAETARDIDPAWPDPHYVLALLAQARGDRAEALAEVRTALRLDDAGAARLAFVYVFPEARANLDALLAQADRRP